MGMYEIDDSDASEFCRLVGDDDKTTICRVANALRPQLPSAPIEEGWRVKASTPGYDSGGPGTCGKPLGDHVLVKHDDGCTRQWHISRLTRIEE